MTSLPSHAFDSANHSEAYNICLDLERKYRNALAPNSGPSKMMCARTLGYMLVEAPTKAGRDAFSHEVKSCDGDENLFELTTHYNNHIIRFFKAAKGTTPAPSDHLSRYSFDEAQVEMKYSLQAPKDYRKGKDAALVRDRYRCALTGTLEGKLLNEPGVKEAFALGSRLGTTNAAHILSEPTSSGISGPNFGGPKHEYAAISWTILDRLSGHPVSQELNGPDVHRVENIITMEAAHHEWFEATDVLNAYTPNAVNPAYLREMPETVTFTSTNPTLYPVPSPVYLGLHAACARVAHLSGAGEYVDTVIRDLEQTSALAADVPSFAL